MATTDLFPDALDWETWTALTLQQKAAAAAPHASPSLIAAALPAIAPHCTCVELVRLTAACRELRAVEQLPIFFDQEDIGWDARYSARNIIDFVRQHGRRFLVPTVSPRFGYVEQHDFNTVLSSVVGLREFRISASQSIGHTPLERRITSLEAAPQARSLTVLHLGSDALHPDFADLGPLAACTNLRRLHLEGCAVRDLSPLTRCARLSELSLSWLNLRDISQLAQIISLRVLTLSKLDGVSDLTALGRLVALEELELIRLTTLVVLEPLKHCTALHSLVLTGCAAIEHVRPLAALSRLKRLTLVGCRELTDVSPLARCSSLETLNLSHCTSLEGDLTALVNECASLRLLVLRSTKAWCQPREGLHVRM